MKHSRVNITLDVELNGARRKKELPLKLLVLGNFGHNKNTKPLGQREKINITPHNLDNVLESISPEISIDNIILKFNKLSDFKPEQLISQIPQLRKLMSMRNLLKDLKANIIDNTELRKSLEKLTHNKSALLKLQQDIQQTSPLIGE